MNPRPFLPSIPLALILLWIGHGLFQTRLSAAEAGQTAASPSKDEKAAVGKAAASAAKEATVAVPEPSRKILVFRNVRSWRRKADFEEALDNLGFKYDVLPSAEMKSTDLSPYGCVIIPGAQGNTDFYRDYAEEAARFDRYVTNGGILLLELNGAERDGITLPRGVAMVRHIGLDNAIIQTNHPILLHRAGQPIHANAASHGYLERVPKDALVLMTEMTADEPVKDKPTFIEYAHGKGRVLAACQCFHDQDGSGRGPMMDESISYAVERIWYSASK